MDGRDLQLLWGRCPVDHTIMEELTIRRDDGSVEYHHVCPTCPYARHAATEKRSM